MIGRTRYSPIGLDVGSRRIKAVQLKYGRAGASVIGAACITRQIPDVAMTPAEGIRVAGTLRRQGFEGARTVVGMPVEKMVSGVLELPPRTSGAPLDAIARQELARSSKCEASRLELAWWELPAAGRVGEGTHAIAMGCKHEDSLPLLDALEGAGLDVIALDAPPAALARAIAPLAGTPPELTAVLEMGWSAAQLLVLHGRVLVYERMIRELGMRQLHARLHEEMDIDGDLAEFVLRTLGCRAGTTGETGMEQAEEARAAIGSHAESAADELRVSMSYAQRRFDGTVARVLVTGGGAEIPGVVERIAQRAGVDTRVVRGDQLASAGGCEGHEALGTSGVCALGLAMHGMAGGGAA